MNNYPPIIKVVIDSLRSAMDLQDRLISEEIWYRFLEKPETVHTADASAASGINLDRLTKNLVARTSEGEDILLIVPGNTRVDLRKVAKALDVRNVSLLPFDEAEGVSGYPPGATPSIFHKTKLRVILDSSLKNQVTLFCGGGTRDRILEIRVDDVVRLNNAAVADIQR
jgi:Cys-tRNA(Pro)/Cys-tRNA(Cys) deacylase